MASSRFFHHNPTYLSLDELNAHYHFLATQYPQWCTLEERGRTRQDRPIFFLTLTHHHSKKALDSKPAFWIDAGTHAAEWAGISAALYGISLWIERLEDGDQSLLKWIENHAIYCIPCICPDGYHALWEGQPYLRSTLRPARIDRKETTGLIPQDLTQDGHIRWMRWKHPAGPFVEDESAPGLMRGRRLSDDPNQAYFMSMEGLFEQWDGWTWKQAPRSWVEALDLNRNFPAHWASFQMFGMDGGLYALSEPESRVVVDTFAQYPLIGAALTYHTFTGALLTQPYRKNSPLSLDDQDLMEALGKQCAEGTDYRVIRVHPDFVYDEENEVVGVWSDTLSSTFGIPGYTLELWDPFKFCDVDNPTPALFFKNPDPEQIRKLALGFKKVPDAWTDWSFFDHPQLGPVELGGLDFMMTIRNPPPSELKDECHRAYLVSDRMKTALPRVQLHTHINQQGDQEGLPLYQVHIGLENVGFLSTSSLNHGESWSGCPKVSLHIHVDQNQHIIQGESFQTLAHLEGWGQASLGLGGLSPSLGGKGHRNGATWWIKGAGQLKVEWSAGRGGRGVIELTLPS